MLACFHDATNYTHALVGHRDEENYFRKAVNPESMMVAFSSIKSLKTVDFTSYVGGSPPLLLVLL